MVLFSYTSIRVDEGIGAIIESKVLWLLLPEKLSNKNMKTDDLNFIGNDPGAVKYGNFINYYSFHSSAHRIKHLCPEMFAVHISNKPILCLDIGCNTGELTKDLYRYVQKIYPSTDIFMLAVDIDPNLIQRAKDSNTETNISFEVVNIMNDSDYTVIENFLAEHNSSMFDITFCFSVTMWIHINNGDKELVTFLQCVTKISRTIVIEPQPWSCYRNAQRRLKKSGGTFPLYEKLKIRNNVTSMIEEIMLQNKTHKKIYESPNSSWNRKIQSYTVEMS